MIVSFLIPFPSSLFVTTFEYIYIYTIVFHPHRPTTMRIYIHSLNAHHYTSIEISRESQIDIHRAQRHTSGNLLRTLMMMMMVNTRRTIRLCMAEKARTHIPDIYSLVCVTLFANAIYRVALFYKPYSEHHLVRIPYLILSLYGSFFITYIYIYKAFGVMQPRCKWQNVTGLEKS